MTVNVKLRRETDRLYHGRYVGQQSSLYPSYYLTSPSSLPIHLCYNGQHQQIN